MKAKSLELERKLYSKTEWVEEPGGYVADHFISLGFQRPRRFYENPCL